MAGQPPLRVPERVGEVAEVNYGKPAAPDYGPLFEALDGIASALKDRPAGNVPVVVFESTLAPSTLTPSWGATVNMVVTVANTDTPATKPTGTVAIQEGATLVRVGTAIFGARPPAGGGRC